MTYSNLAIRRKWLTLFCLMFTLVLSGCSGSLNTSTDDNILPGPEPVPPPVDEISPVIVAEIEKDVLEAGEPAQILVTFIDANNAGAALSAGEANVSFSSECLSKGQSNMLDDLGQEQSEFVSSEGLVSATYKSNGCVGLDTITVQGTFDGISAGRATVVVTVNPDQVDRIVWVSNSHEQLVTKGVNGDNVADVTFEVIGTRGARVINQEITFSFEGVQGAPELLDDTVVSNDSGLVTVQVRAGYFPAQIVVKAEHPDAEFPGSSEPISVIRGVASQGNFNLQLNRYAPLSLDRSEGQVTPLTVIATVNDRYGKPVLDNTLVQLYVEGSQPSQPNVGAIGELIGECRTEKGVCRVEWHPNMNNVPDGYVTIMGIVKGEENFIDKNSNGIFDEGDDFLQFDQPEPFLDHKQTWGWR
ncbi:MAG: hypothetical protein OXE99_00425, partial [Cellvibrionales bacterium]|nr:hypothetical protein [Cellvibrionales bacterium]